MLHPWHSSHIGRDFIRSAFGARTADKSELPQAGIMNIMKKTLVSIVEDDRFFRDSMRRLMRSLGYMFDVFSSAAEFLASPRLNETACLIVDVNMPAMSGLELYRRLVDMGHAIPTILITAFPNDVDRARALNDGVTCYLAKPVDQQDLIRCLDTVLASGDDLP